MTKSSAASAHVAVSVASTDRTPGLKADLAANALVDASEHLWNSSPRGWFRRDAGLVASASGLPMPAFNTVCLLSADFDDDALRALLDEVAGPGLPHTLQVRPGAADRGAAIALERNMEMDERTPLMVIHTAQHFEPPRRIRGLTIRQLRPGEVGVHVDLVARGFETPFDVLEQVLTPEVLLSEGTRVYVGECSGLPVTTGVGVRLGKAAGIYNIATPPEYRGRGYGAAVTARAVADAFASGADWAYLQSSAAGYDIYRSLGFETVEIWDSWVSAT